MNKLKQTVKYITVDYLSALLAWFLFFNLRKILVEKVEYTYPIFIDYCMQYWVALFGIPAIWILLYFTIGHYRDVYRKSRLKELGKTFTVSLFGVVVIFFFLILDDPVYTYKDYYSSFLILFATHFFLTWILRFSITSTTKRKIRNKKIGFNTLMIGSNEKASELLQDIKRNDEGYGYNFIGFIDVFNNKKSDIADELEYLGNLNNVLKVIEKYKVEEVIIALDSSKHAYIEKILNKLQHTDVIIKAIPSLFDMLKGKVRISFFLGTPLIIVSHEIMPAWQQNIKKTVDISFSIIAILLLIPVFLFSIIAIKFTSKGSFLYFQERIGKGGKPFNIIKFRTMKTDAEKDGPQLSSAFDMRVTKIGRFMRRYRIDEIPQFFNVLKGDMSLVGPRPERQFYIDKIMEKAPHYSKLLKVKPGITSWGAVKYGYTENVEQMLEQLKYDIFYVENVSLYLDFKILISTIKVVLKREGK